MGEGLQKSEANTADFPGPKETAGLEMEQQAFDPAPISDAGDTGRI